MNTKNKIDSCRNNYIIKNLQKNIPIDIISIICNYTENRVVIFKKQKLIFFNEINHFDKQIYVNITMRTCNCEMYYYYKHTCDHIMSCIISPKKK